MRIAVFGATGMAGSAIVSEAITRRHQVIAASRQPSTTTFHDDRLAVRAVDVANPDAVDPVLAEADAAVLTIRLAPGEEHHLAPLTRGFLDVAERQRTRVLIVGGSAPLRSPNYPDRLLIDDPDHVPPAWKTIAQASLHQYKVCQEHPYPGWVYLSPPAVFEPGRRSGGYIRGTTIPVIDANGVSRITAPDFAIAVLDELENPGKERHFTVGQQSPS